MKRLKSPKSRAKPPTQAAAPSLLRQQPVTIASPRESVIIQNAVWIPEEDLYLRSVNRHDYITWKSKDGKVDYAIDGGQGPGCYIRRVGTTFGRVTEWCLTDQDAFDVVAERLLWGTYGKDGKGPMRWRPIASLEVDHLRAILDTQPHIRGTLSERVVQHWFAQKTDSLEA